MKITLSPGDVGADVAVLQRRLNAKGANLVVDHIYGTLTMDAVRDFQGSQGLVADGIAGPRTMQALLGIEPDSRRLAQADIEAAARTLQCHPAAIQAVVAVEAPRGGYLDDGRTVILYERHVMYRLLRESGIDPEPYVAARPDIVNRARGGYLGGAAEYGRLAAAKQIDETCARRSCSWGRFQIMGYHYAALGYDSVQAFVDDMARNEGRQLSAFVKFVQADAKLLQALRDRDWPAFARGYNGPDYAANHYDVRLAQAYQSVPVTAADYVPDTPPEAEKVAAEAPAADAGQPAKDSRGAGRRGNQRAKAAGDAAATA